MPKIWIVDAFASKPFTGNPAAVMILDEFYDDKRLLDIAAEMNLSETAFVKPIKDNLFHIRWFTPTVEIKLCGHATLAPAHILFETGIVKNQPILFDSLSGRLQVTQEADGLQLDFPLQKTGETLARAPFEKALRLQDEIINVVQAYDDIIVEVDSEETVYNFQPDFALIATIEARAIIITAGSNRYDFVSRFFGPRVGINEDPVTGSSHCKLAHYWSQKLGKNTLHAYQASKRGGLIDLKVVDDRVYLKGTAVTILAGEFYPAS